MAKLTILGVYHDDNHEDFPIVMDYVDKITVGSRVSLECSVTLEILLNLDENDISQYESGTRFFNTIARKLNDKNIDINVVENAELHSYQRLCLDQNEEVITEIEHWFIYLSLLRSIEMYHQIIENGSTHAILGAQHTYDIAAIGFETDIHYTSFRTDLIFPTEVFLEDLKKKIC